MSTKQNNIFQSTLPREERQIHIQFFLSKTPYFNPRSHERSDPVTLFCDYQGGFQSTLPREERPTAIRWLRTMLRISIHAPTRGATSIISMEIPGCIFQSTLPREERHYNRLNDIKRFHISIHAPTRGATLK